VDSSAWFALKDIKDPYHGDSIQFLSSFTGKLVTTNFIVDEAITLALVRLNHKFAHELGEDLWAEKYARLIHVTKADQRAAWELFNVTFDHAMITA
jgi:predicted nucleic acid-binding protein